MAESKKKEKQYSEIEAEMEMGLNEFDITALLVDPQAVIERSIKYFDVKTQKPAKMKVYLRPINHSIWNMVNQKVSKNPRSNVEEIIAEKGWCSGPDGIALDEDTIRQVQKGVVSAVYEELKFVSGYFEDRMEEKFLERVANPS